MMKPTRHILFGLSLLTATAFTTSCNSVLGDDDINHKEADTMELAFTRSGESSSATSGFLIFWKETKGDFFTTEVANLNAYQTIKYNTGKPYPKEGTEVSVTGFSPSNMQLANDYQTLSLPDGTTAGTLDVCAAEKIIRGSHYNIFRETMVFEHTLTKVTFYAKRDETMEGNQLVNNIQVTIPENYLATEWQWNGILGKYVAGTTHNTDLVSDRSEPLTEVEKAYNIIECYLKLPASNEGTLQNITMEADVRKVGETSGQAKHKIWKLKSIQLYEKDGETPVANAAAGDAYQVVFNFDHDSFSLQAIKKPWEKGGLITVPIDPNGGESNHNN